MAANTSPIFSKAGDIKWADLTAPLKAANTTRDLSSGTSALVFTSDATNGGRVDKIRIQPLGTNVATVLRLWINNGSSPASAVNNTLYEEVTIAATTASEVAKLAYSEILLGVALPPSFRLYATVGVPIAAGVSITAIAGAY